jgi:hypothetical protein
MAQNTAKGTRKIRYKDVNWFQLAQSRFEARAFMNTTKTLWFLQSRVILKQVNNCEPLKEGSVPYTG